MARATSQECNAACIDPVTDHSRPPSRLRVTAWRPLAISLPLVILDLAGFAALLLWGVHMVQTGVQRTFGRGLRSLTACRPTCGSQPPCSLGAARTPRACWPPEKEAFRAVEADAVSAHYQRLQSGNVSTVETSSLHLDALRDLKRVNSHLIEGAAYPVLSAKGALLPTRLRSIAQRP